MSIHWTFGRKLALGFAAAMLALIVVAGFGYRSTQRLIENDKWVRHTFLVRETTQTLSAAMKDAETGQRGYVITGEESYLEPYTNARSTIDASYASLRELTSDNPDQQRRLDALKPNIDAKLAELKLTIDMRRESGFETTQKEVRTNKGKQSMDEVRRILGEMDHAESTLLEARRQEAEAAAASTQSVILWGAAIGALFVAFVGWFISRSLTLQIGAAVRHMQSSAAELQAAATQQATGTKEQSTAMTEITTTIGELLATSRQIAQSAQSVAQIAEKTASAARTGTATVGKGRDAVAGIQRQVDVIVSHMLELGKKSQQIGSVLDIVSELAEQTNILAINATIEATVAGESGKRFGVVADEIRKLADRVTGSTKEIRSLIDDVRAAVNTTVMTTETGSKAVDAGSRQFLDVTAAFEQIVGQVSTTTEAAREIELSTKQQASAVEQVNVAVVNVAGAAKETQVSTSQTLQTASELAVLSRELLRIVESDTRAGATAG